MDWNHWIALILVVIVALGVGYEVGSKGYRREEAGWDSFVALQDSRVRLQRIEMDVLTRILNSLSGHMGRHMFADLVETFDGSRGRGYMNFYCVYIYRQVGESRPDPILSICVDMDAVAVGRKKGAIRWMPRSPGAAYQAIFSDPRDSAQDVIDITLKYIRQFA